jgi:hypothetical protein
MVVMVTIQKVRRGKLGKLIESAPRWHALDERHGFPPQKWYTCMFGGHEIGTRLGLREWESMAAIEAAHESWLADPEAQELLALGRDVIESTQYQLFTPEEWSQSPEAE